MDLALDFNRLVVEYEPRIVRYLACLLRDEDLARDLTQETFLRVYKGLEQLKNPEALTAWIYQIASNVAFDHLRSRTSRQEGKNGSLEAELLNGERMELPILSEEVSAEGRLEQEEMAACLHHYVYHLPGVYRACLILRDLEGLGEKAVAEVLGCSVGVVKVRTHRARNKLRELLREGCRFYKDERSVLRCEPIESREKGRD